MAEGMLADRAGLPLAVCANSATPHEVTLVAPTLDSRFVANLPRRLIGDRAYDADPLDVELARLGVEMITPQRRNRKKPKTRDGRPLRRYKVCWIIKTSAPAPVRSGKPLLTNNNKHNSAFTHCFT
jgi:hypothetical protein